MKTQVILLFLLASITSTAVYAIDTEPKKEKKIVKSKYNFNIFKLYSIAAEQDLPDSLKVELRVLPPKRK